MRKVFIIMISSILPLSIAANFSQAQCGSEEHTSACISQLQDGFTFLRSFKVDGQSGAKPKAEYSYVFSKDVQYNFTICSEGPATDGIIITMYDSERNKVTTNYEDGKIYPGLIYVYKASDIYYLPFTSRDSEHFCGGSVLGFRREISNN